MIGWPHDLYTTSQDVGQLLAAGKDMQQDKHSGWTGTESLTGSFHNGSGYTELPAASLSC
jgi:hypothetical protein